MKTGLFLNVLDKNDDWRARLPVAVCRTASCAATGHSMSTSRHRTKRTQPRIDDLQLALPIDDPLAQRVHATSPQAVAKPPRKTTPIDQILPTREVAKIAGRHRCTLYRWMKDGEFPQRHRSGWRRSDIERWLAAESQGNTLEGRDSAR
jgi:predicted DNA-binding transcriptional regulator AlpA